MTKHFQFLDTLMDAQAEQLKERIAREDRRIQRKRREGLTTCDCCGKLRPEEDVHEFYDVKLNPYRKCQWCLEDDWG